MIDSQILTQVKSRQPWTALLYALGFLIILQLIRALLFWASSQFMTGNLPLLNELSTLITFGGLSLIWLLVLRPTKSQIGLSLVGMSRTNIIVHIIMAAILLMLFGLSAFIDLRMLAANLATALVVPVAEELIFRGFLWNKLEGTLSGRWQQPLTWAITTALFALWHLGYIDAVARNPLTPGPQETSLAFIMFMKVLVGGAVGFLAGLGRWKTKRVYAAIFIHAVWNIFGR